MSILNKSTTFSWADEVEAEESHIILSCQSNDSDSKKTLTSMLHKPTLHPSFALEEDKYDINGRNVSAQERRQENIAWSTVVRH